MSVKIDSNQLNNINMIYSKFFLLPRLHVFSGSETISYKFTVGKVHVFKKICKDPSSLTLIKKLVTPDWRLCQKSKNICSCQCVTESSKKIIYQQECAYMIILNHANKATLPSMKIEFYGWKVTGGDYNLVPKWFSGYQLLVSMANH